MAKSLKNCSAKEILSAKGYVQKSFPTNDFLLEVADFFRDHDISDALYIYTSRFIDRYDDAEFYINRSFDNKWLYDIPFERFEEYFYKGIAVPNFLVDEPYVKNVVFALKTIGGFVVKKEKVMKIPRYKITLL
jgi:hypothetical protein